MEQYDLLFIADATASMGDFLISLNTSLPRTIAVSELTGCFSRIGLLAYRDYSDNNLLEWSGWLHTSLDADADQPDLVGLAKSLEPDGGGDYPEAAKTALAKAYEEMRPDATTIILFYTDAVPHKRADTGPRSNGEKEWIALSDKQSYGGCGPKFVDWVSACNELRNGEKKAQVFCMLEKDMAPYDAGYFNYLSTMTRGSCVYLKSSKPSNISAVTMELLLGWMGVERVEPAGNASDILQADMSRFVNAKGIKQLKGETDKMAKSFFSASYAYSDNFNLKESIGANIARKPVTSNSLKEYLPKKSTPVLDFAESWSTNPAYQALAIKNLKKIIDEDINAITTNPVFGKLWRTVCSDRTNEARIGLVEAFSVQVQRNTNPEDKARLTAWLEESYDNTAEIQSAIDGVPANEKFPCVFLDPTLSFAHANADLSDEEDDSNTPLTTLTRAQLLEIGRSCDARILKRLGRILTQLTYVETAADMPEHIAATADDEVPKIPIALASNDYGRRFWKILLHLIVPGTMLSARPAALLAALSIRLGIAPLTQAADREMLSFKNKWNDIEVPENWNVSCLSLLLDADLAYSQRQDEAKTDYNGEEAPKKSRSTLLKKNDRALFKHLIAYRMLELNLDSTLIARIGWTPEKATAPIGPLVVCRSCNYPRSVTIMGNNKKCGICLSTDPKELKSCVDIGVSAEDKETNPAIWVECCVQSCRAQYVVYNREDLNVRAKCHYCRVRGTQAPAESKKTTSLAPWVECKECLNRVIWPVAYRPSSFVKEEFVCPPCMSGHESVTDVETTAKKLSGENAISWLVFDTKNPDGNPFTHRSLFNTISTFGIEAFVSRIKLFPPIKSALTIKGKPVQNCPALISRLQGFLSRRQTEKVPCSLCFSDFRPSALNQACGRRGCLQYICVDCLSGWYGLNGMGRIINTAALYCPFCRRHPSPRTLAKHGMGIHAVRGLTDAVRDKGTWIYGWCASCSSAKQYMERVCARGMPTELHEWLCDECQEQRDRTRLEQVFADEQIARNMQGIDDRTSAQRRAEAVLEARRASKLKPCPSCGTVTEKTFGCGHIECPVPGCNAHWCYFCGSQFDEGYIYTHMEREHGGCFADEDEELAYRLEQRQQLLEC